MTDQSSSLCKIVLVMINIVTDLLNKHTADIIYTTTVSNRSYSTIINPREEYGQSTKHETIQINRCRIEIHQKELLSSAIFNILFLCKSEKSCPEYNVKFGYPHTSRSTEFKMVLVFFDI